MTDKQPPAAPIEESVYNEARKQNRAANSNIVSTGDMIRKIARRKDHPNYNEEQYAAAKDLQKAARAENQKARNLFQRLEQAFQNGDHLPIEEQMRANTATRTANIAAGKARRAADEIYKATRPDNKQTTTE